MVEDLLDEAIQVVRQAGYASTGLLQRKLQIGYFVAEALLKKLEDLKIVTEANGAWPRKLLE